MAGDLRLTEPPGSLDALPAVSSDAILTLAVGYGLRTVPSGVDANAWSPPALADEAAGRLVGAFGDTGAFQDVRITGPGSSLSGRVYSLDVVLNTRVDVLPQEPQSSGFVLLRLGSKEDGPQEIDFDLGTETSLFAFGTEGGPAFILADTREVSGSTVAAKNGESGQLQLAWSAALDAAVPHIVRTVLQRVAEEEAKLPPPAPGLPQDPTLPAGATPPPELPALEPLPELDELEELPSLD